MYRVGYIGNFYRIPEYIIHSEFKLEYVIVETGCLPDDMFTFLKVRNIPYAEAKNGNDLVECIEKIDVDFWITCSYGKRIPMEKLPSTEIYNIHYAALPLYKGRHPTFYATMADEKNIGISLHKVTQKLDEGDIIAQKFVPYYLWENENSLFEKLTMEIPTLFEKLDLYKQGLQDDSFSNSEGSYFSPVVPSDYTIDAMNDSPKSIFNKVRAQAKYRGALLNFENKQYWIRKVVFSKNDSQDEICIKRDDYYMIFYVK